eukprot:scaffold5351_cov199-Alexandrium_tamarense.AAC.33
MGDCRVLVVKVGGRIRSSGVLEQVRRNHNLKSLTSKDTGLQRRSYNNYLQPSTTPTRWIPPPQQLL